jgi:malonyl-CoA/methylmalonyl-CoA synthetase
VTNVLFDELMAHGAPGALAIETPARSWTYEQLARDCARLAAALVSLGVAPGDRVAVQVEKSAANLILYLAVIRAGGVYLPLNTAYTRSELSYFIADAEPALIVCDPGVRESVAAIAGEALVETLDRDGEGTLTERARACPDHMEPIARAADDLAAICYTSGTTGRSKGAMLTHGALLSNADTLTGLWRFTEGDVLIHALPIYHVHGLFVATHVVLLAGASMILQPRFDAAAVTQAMPRATVLMGVPTFYTRLLAHEGLTAEAAGRMRLFVSGSAPLLAQTHQAWEARTGRAILERYGMTETGMNTSNPYDGPRVAGAVGPPLPGVAVRIAGEASGAPAEGGEVGRVEVKGPNVFAGYWRNPQKTAGAFTADGWFKTGDLGVIDAAGYLRLVGRANDLIISGGLNVYPAEVEEAIDALPGVIESAVIGLPHADLGEAVTAVVAARGEASEANILAALEGRLARFKRPRRILFVGDLPRNTMGKVVKAQLRQTYATLYGEKPQGPAV